MHFLIQNDAFPETQQTLVNLLINKRIDHTVWDKDSQPPIDGKNNKVFVIGTVDTMMHLLYGRYRYQIWFGKAFDYNYIISHLNKSLNVSCLFMTTSQLLRLIELNEIDENNDPIFIKGNASFTNVKGEVVKATEAHSFAQHLKQVSYKEELLAISDVFKIDEEYRLIVKSKYNEATDKVEHTILTSSVYISNGEIVTEYYPASTDILSQAQNILNTSDYHPYPIWVFDIAVCNNKVFTLEANSLNSSGLYGCDLEPIVDAILTVEREELV